MNHYEYRSRTQKRIEKISTEVLKVREAGITSLRTAIDDSSKGGDREETRDLIATMNYSVSQVQKELRNRKKK